MSVFENRMRVPRRPPAVFCQAMNMAEEMIPNTNASGSAALKGLMHTLPCNAPQRHRSRNTCPRISPSYRRRDFDLERPY